MADVKNVLPTREDWRASRMPILRGSGVGFVIGVLPAGATIASFLAYILEKVAKILRASARERSRRGRARIDEQRRRRRCDSAGLSLGVPGSGTTAIILGALIMFGIRPGPELFTKNADLVWA